jgi:hypothetical protein
MLCCTTTCQDQHADHCAVLHMLACGDSCICMAVPYSLPRCTQFYNDKSSHILHML